MRQYLNLVDMNTGGRRNDVTPLFTDAEAFAQVGTDVAAPFEIGSFDLVAGIDALGFVLGAALALHTQKGFLKAAKGCGIALKQTFAKEGKMLRFKSGGYARRRKQRLTQNYLFPYEICT